MLKVVSQCVGLLPIGLVYDNHSKALLDRPEVLVEVLVDTEMC